MIESGGTCTDGEGPGARVYAPAGTEAAGTSRRPEDPVGVPPRKPVEMLQQRPESDVTECVMENVGRNTPWDLWRSRSPLPPPPSRAGRGQGCCPFCPGERCRASALGPGSPGP